MERYLDTVELWRSPGDILDGPIRNLSTLPTIRATPGWTVAGQLRSDLAVLGGSAWQAEWHQTNDRDVDADSATWSRSATGS